MRIIIAGAGEVGTHLAKLLSREDMDICLMDERQERLGDLDANYDMLTKVGSPTSIHDLKDIGVRNADLFIAVTPFETENITACMLANQLGAKKTLARVDNYEYIQPENKQLFEAMGLNHLIYPEVLAAHEIEAALKTNWMRYHLTLCDGLIPLHRHHPLEKVSGIMFLLRKIKAETCLSTLKSTMYIPVSDRGVAPLIHVDIWFLELRVVVAGFYCVYRCCFVHEIILLFN